MPSSSRARAHAQPEQLALGLMLPQAKGAWGGARKGAGRKAKIPGARPNVPHRRRPAHKGRHPVHVTMRAASGVPSLRSPLAMGVLKRALWRQAKCFYEGQFQVVHFSVQRDHVHLIVEASANGGGEAADAAARDALRRGIAGLAISLARRLNRALGRKGAKVWGDRHHRRDLTTPSEVRNALVYVLENHLRHGAIALGDGVVDTCSSALRFDGWKEPHVTRVETEPWPARRARTWLLGTGWMRAGGKIEMWALPSGAVRRSYRRPGA